MKKNDFLTVAAFQCHITEGDSQANLEKVLETANLAEKQEIDLLCFPESYLHGYFSSREHALQHAIDLKSPEFANLCKRFSRFHTTTVLLGLNEVEENRIYNTIVVIEKGVCLGRYRKAYTYSPYDYYSLGREFPVFEKKGVKYGVMICLDSAYREPAHLAALQGARIIFCPSFNRVQNDAHMLNYLQRKSHFISRAFDNHCWIVVSDIIWDKAEEVCPGFASIWNDNGELAVKAEPFQEMLITYPIPLANLREGKRVRLFGNPELFELVIAAYKKATRS
jgi:predicted amidohydrolase